MSDNFNKPKDIASLGVSFEERLAQLGKLSKQNRGSNAGVNTPATNHGQTSAGYPAQRQTSEIDSSRTINQNSKQALDAYKEKGKSKQILKVWFMLMQAFDSKMKVFFGDEPDVHFMKFAASLTPESYKRLEANLLERLDEDREWPPSLIRLRQLANSPTKEMMYKARQHLFHHPVPIDELDRVELFIKRYKMREVRSFSERNFEAEFNRKYTQWFREVILEDMDKKLEEERARISAFIDVESTNEHDKEIDQMIAQGKAFQNPLGERIAQMLREKKSQTPEISDVTAEEIAQERGHNTGSAGEV